MLSKSLNALLAICLIAFASYYIYKLPKFGKGEIAPDFEAEVISGENFILSNLQGDYVLLDFWGSWCGPCRMENRELVKLNNAYSTSKTADGEGFHIVSVAIETAENSWKNAIEKDGLNWPLHIYQKGRFKGPIAKQYGVREIPTKYLISPKGEIISVNPSFDEIRSILPHNN